MSVGFLGYFPREIRDKIYTYVLACPSGSLGIFPWIYAPPNFRYRTVPYDPDRNIISGEEGVIHLSLLRTCKQIHRECKDIIWAYNGLRVRELTKLYDKFRLYSTFRKIRRIQHVRIHLELLDWDELEWMSKSLRAFAVLAREGSLECIWLIATRDKRQCRTETEDLSNLRKHGEHMDGRWYRAASISTLHALPQRTFAINTGWPRFSHWGKQNWLRGMLLDTARPNQLLKEMHDTFGGQLHVNGLLCYKDHVEVVETFTLNPREGEIKILPRREQAGS